MRPVEISAHLGQRIIVDQCPDCGGIWFDRSEVHRARDGEAERIEAADPEALRSPAALARPELFCPRDRQRLVPLEDKYFPNGIVVARCPMCDGFWLNRGEFTKYQSARRRLRQPREVVIENDPLQHEVGRIMAEYRAGAADNGLVRAARFLSTPIDRVTLRPLESDVRAPEGEDAVNATLSVLASILSLFMMR